MDGRNAAIDTHDCSYVSLHRRGRLAACHVVSPCECRHNHGQHRWSVKIDASLPPTDANVIQAVTPSDIYGWPGPDVPLTQSSERHGNRKQMVCSHGPRHCCES